MTSDSLYASEFSEIPQALSKNDPLRVAMQALIASEPMPGKVTEGAARLAAFRKVLRDLTAGTIDLQGAIARTEIDLSRASSPYSSDNRVFPTGWSERLVRTQLSRFYNQTVMDLLQSKGQTRCFVPHNNSEAASSPCSAVLAGKDHAVADLRALLVGSYSQGVWSTSPKIPNHPHCTHVVTPT